MNLTCKWPIVFSYCGLEENLPGELKAPCDAVRPGAACAWPVNATARITAVTSQAQCPPERARVHIRVDAIEIGMVQHVDCVCAELQLHAFRDGECLRYRRIEVVVPGTAKQVTSHTVADGTSAGVEENELGVVTPKFALQAAIAAALE